MKLWLVSRTDRIGYDEYDAVVVAAETEDAARKTYPSGDLHIRWDEEKGTFTSTIYEGRWFDHSWGKVSDLTVEYLGTTDREIEGVILASFNAG